MQKQSIICCLNPNSTQNQIREYLTRRNIPIPSQNEIFRHFNTKSTATTLKEKIKSKSLHISDLESIPFGDFGSLPRILVDLVNLLASNSHHQGIFRISPSTNTMDKLLDRCDRRDCLLDCNVNEAAGLFLRLISAFGGPIISSMWNQTIQRCKSRDPDLIYLSLSLLPLEIVSILKCGMNCLNRVAEMSSANMMSYFNLSTVVMPAVMEHVGRKSRYSLKDALLDDRKIVEMLIVGWEKIGVFDGELLQVPRGNGILTTMSQSCARFARKAASVSKSMLSSTRSLRRPLVDEIIKVIPVKTEMVQPSRPPKTSRPLFKNVRLNRRKSVKPLVEDNIAVRLDTDAKEPLMCSYSGSDEE